MIRILLWVVLLFVGIFLLLAHHQHGSAIGFGHHRHTVSSHA